MLPGAAPIRHELAPNYHKYLREMNIQILDYRRCYKLVKRISLYVVTTNL